MASNAASQKVLALTNIRKDELRVVEVPMPTFTFPRVGKTVQILRDLGLIDLDQDRHSGPEI